MDDPLNRRVHDLMQQLVSLIDGESAAGRLVACGRAAVEPLRRFLFDTPLRTVAQPRCWAVRALAGLGEKDLLVEYLQRDMPTADAVLRLGEETVQRTAALSLASGWQTDDVFETLLRISVQRPIPGVIEALGRFERRRAVPVLVSALGDDFCRPWAETALTRVATRDRDLLIPAAVRRTLNNGQETSASLHRRRTLLWVLRNVHLSADESHVMVSAIDDADHEIAISAAAIAIAHGCHDDSERARRRLLQIAPLVPWHLDYDVKQLLRASAVADQPASDERKRG